MSEAHEIDAPLEERDYEAEARLMGWHPQDEFRGNPDDWVDARTFITRGEQQLPILRENNRKLQARVRRTDDDNAELRQQMNEMRESLSTMRTMLERGQEVGYQRAKAEFEAQMREAVRSGDEARFDKIQADMEKLDEQHDAIKAPTEPKAPAPPTKPKLPGTPEFQAWFEENKVWLLADPVLQGAANSASKALDESDEPLSQDEYWEKVTEMVQTKYPRRFAAATGKPFTPAPSQTPSSDGVTPRAAAVLRPTGGAPSFTKKTGIDSITDPGERKEARMAYNRIKNSIPDYTEAEYMRVYVNPSADVIGDAVSRKAKANGTTH